MCYADTMSKIREQILKLADEQGPCKSIPEAQLNALLDGRGRVEFLQKLADEYGVELKLEKRPRKQKENADGSSK
jgi:hypothetical protein